MENTELKAKINKAEEEKDLGTLENIHDEAEATLEGEIAGLAKQAIDRLNGLVEDAEKTPAYAEQSLGAEKVEESTAEVTKEMEELKEITEEKIEAVVEDSVEKNIYKQQLKDLTLSIGLNKQAQTALESFNDKEVASAPFTNSLGTALMFVNETKEIQRLTEIAMSLPRNSAEQNTAWEKFREFSDKCSETGAMDVEIKGGTAQDAYVLVKGVNAIYTQNNSLKSALENTLKDQEERLKDLQEKVK